MEYFRTGATTREITPSKTLSACFFLKPESGVEPATYGFVVRTPEFSNLLNLLKLLEKLFFILADFPYIPRFSSFYTKSPTEIHTQQLRTHIYLHSLHLNRIINTNRTDLKNRYYTGVQKGSFIPLSNITAGNIFLTIINNRNIYIVLCLPLSWQRKTSPQRNHTRVKISLFGRYQNLPVKGFIPKCL
jgi:hypothetical protein